MKQIILATNNSHKVKEFSILFGPDFNFKTLKEIGFNGEIIENGKSFIENALIKCESFYSYLNIPVLADDSGLCVEALNGDPGIFSARYGGNELTDKDRYLLLLKNLNNPNRNASFVCALVLYINPNRVYIVQEECRGEILESPRGENGFGYDPVFYFKELDKSFAELTESEKNKFSHRGKASSQMIKIVKNIKF